MTQRRGNWERLEDVVVFLERWIEVDAFGVVS